MYKSLKKFYKLNSHNNFTKALAGFGRALNRLYENRNYDPDTNGEATILKKISRFNPEIIIDGGANTGAYATLVNIHCPSAKVYSFEPVKETYQKLVANIAGNNNNITVNKGLYNEKCSKTINIFSSDEHASLYTLTSQSATSTIIELIKGDDFLTQHNIEQVFFLKLDVEGAEYSALQGFEHTLKNGSIRLIQFEYGYINIATKLLLMDYYALLESYGFIVGKVFPKKVEFRKYEFKHEDFLDPNFIAVHHSEVELIKELEKSI